MLRWLRSLLNQMFNQGNSDIALSDKQKNILIEALDRHGKELNMTDRLLSKGKDGVKSQLSRWHNFWSRNQDNIAREGRSEDDRPAAHSLRRQYARNEFKSGCKSGKCVARPWAIKKRHNMYISWDLINRSM